MQTRSEALFDEYCRLRKYSSVPIDSGSALGKTPDRLVTTPQSQVVVEIKELAANAEDIRQARELRIRGWSHGGGMPGARVFDHIKSAAPQLKRHAEPGLPCVLVLYENIVVDGIRVAGKYLDPAFIDFGMYGLQTVILAANPGISDPHTIRSGRGGRRQLTPESRKYISAVQVLQEVRETSEPYILTYHNFYARWPLATTTFDGPNDRHFQKSRHPDASPQEWIDSTEK
jgi:hypothetical protein